MVACNDCDADEDIWGAYSTEVMNDRVFIHGQRLAAGDFVRWLVAKP